MTDKPTITQGDNRWRCHNCQTVTLSQICPERCFECKYPAFSPVTLVNSVAIAELQAEVERLNNAIEKICIESNSDWAKVRDEPRDQIDVIHNIAMDAFFHKHVLAQKEPVE